MTPGISILSSTYAPHSPTTHARNSCLLKHHKPPAYASTAFEGRRVAHLSRTRNIFHIHRLGSTSIEYSYHYLQAHKLTGNHPACQNRCTECASGRRRKATWSQSQKILPPPTLQMFKEPALNLQHRQPQRARNHSCPPVSQQPAPPRRHPPKRQQTILRNPHARRRARVPAHTPTRHSTLSAHHDKEIRRNQHPQPRRAHEDLWIKPEPARHGSGPGSQDGEGGGLLEEELHVAVAVGRGFGGR
ncbi:uncharacterized protein K441DRAFT_699373 [Cenococcum geophilum 1.58]|uniref:uncharacterized protein n=1 Tax=Cenococcum geophilum 1.58 TaxID=794803 RepID=UPI00358EDD30|nr:hypothetical protein K441DRAFT_699373 [Cenococcum geophilum 1.58]